MTRKSIFALVVSILLVVGGGLWAQNRKDPTAVTAAPHVVSGDDVGVRLTGASDKSGRLTGTLIVKVNGQWVDVVSPGGVVLMK
jgi:hypothetical protein